MPSIKIHCAISKKRTGNRYFELHKWIDDNKEDRSVNHRSKNHYYTEELKNFVKSEFGGAEAVSEWLFHIALDNLDTYITNEWTYNNNSNNYVQFGFKENGFILVEERDCEDEGDLEELFDDSEDDLEDDD